MAGTNRSISSTEATSPSPVCELPATSSVGAPEDSSGSSVEVLTFGCRLNAYESEVMRRHALDAGLSDVVIVNSCAVTAEAERQVRQAIRRARRENPSASIVVTGCAAQLAAEKFAAMPEVTRVLGNAEKMAPGSWLPRPDQPRVSVADIQQVRETAGHLLPGFESRTRAFLQVQNGCDHRCTFCIIPYARGPARSVPVAQVVAQVQELILAGVGEVVFSGVDLTSYGQDLGVDVTLGGLVRRVLHEVPGLRRLRISSVDPCEIDEDLWRAVAEEERLMPHFHLSLQSGDDMILKRMKRRHSRAQSVEVAQRLRRLRPGAAIGADLIAGFPTETEEMFRNSLELIGDCGLVHLHVFPYSERSGTPAARMPSMPKSVRKARAAALRAAGEKALVNHLAAKLGRIEEVHIESDGRGLAPDFSRVVFPQGTPPAPAGSFRQARIVDVVDQALLAEFVQGP
ncbi:MAG TPA: tRNA (N(6)-L-threonylcarbamoyladenosine(37)-C(2))-methylthiotransferase MtaB [Deltaproteobacteria bacterium]|nr:tRNA (N(6)-L-threonylcarbamoyladenosine(37)-C(2))-methylthiotransferase MtaB [Deltaproteobacteria bacterium]